MLTTPNLSQASDLFAFYQSPRLLACAKRLIHMFTGKGFTGKPISLGGPTLSPDERAQNRLALCTAIDASHPNVLADKLATASQVHSAISKCHTEADLSACDAIILTEKNQPALILVADCVPVILYDPTAHKGAVIHAGWRGTAASISVKTATRLVEEFGCSYQNMIVAIGPSIGVCCYEVSDEVVSALSDSLAGQTETDWRRDSHLTSEKSIVDLKRVNQLQLQALGITEIDVLNHCTQCEPERFFSYRRGDYGRQGVVLMLK